MSKAEAAEIGHKEKDRALHCQVITPEKTLIDEVVEFVALPLSDGELGVLPGRSPLIGRLGYGELRTRSTSSTHHYYIDGGFAQVRDDFVTVLTNHAIPAAKIDEVAASKDLEIALARKAITDPEIAEKDKAIARARAQLRVAEHA